jgi:aryl sulfotransferase
MSQETSVARFCWLASFPKSGNTWTRILLTNYLRDADTPADINDLETDGIASLRGLFDEVMGIESSDLSPAEIDRFRPDLYRCINRSAERLLFMKVHDAYTYTSRNEPLFPLEVTHKVVYLVRNPMDVSLSYANHQAREVADVIKGMANPEESLNSRPDRIVAQFPQKLLDWSGHAASWLNSPLPLLVIRYEDLKADPEGTLARLVFELGLSPHSQVDERVQKAVRFSDISELQRQESEKGFKERMPLSPKFFNSGTAERWRQELADELVDQILLDHSSMMRRLGYLPDSGNPKEVGQPDQIGLFNRPEILHGQVN